MRILCVFGQHNYGDPTRGEGYEYTNFLPTLRRLGHEIIFFESWNRKKHRSFAELNQQLLFTVEQQKPDLIFAVLFTFEVWLETWQLIQDAGISATVNWTTDDSWKYRQFSRLIAPSLNAFTTTYPDIYKKYHADGINNVILTQWAADSSKLQSPLPSQECRYDVSFVGTAHSTRRSWIESLRKQGIDVACFGYGWANGVVKATDIPQIIRNSKISLNFAGGEPSFFAYSPNQIKARTFEVPGAGGFLLTEWAKGIDQYYIPDQEFAVFRNIDELVVKIHYYLANPSKRDKVAHAAFVRTSNEHTYEQRLKSVIEYALQQKNFQCKSRKQPSTSKINWEKFEEIAKTHLKNHYPKYVKSILIPPCRLLWGDERGKRAARRLLFEFSWRLLGSYTYSAAGWPGRIFYEVS